MPPPVAALRRPKPVPLMVPLMVEAGLEVTPMLALAVRLMSPEILLPLSRRRAPRFSVLPVPPTLKSLVKDLVVE